MLDILREEYEFFVSYSGNSLIMVLYVLSLIYIGCAGKEMRRKLLYPSLLLMFVILNPFFYTYIWKRLLDNVFWRMMWMFPVVPCIAYAAAGILGRIRRWWLRALVCVGMMAVVAVSGQFIYADNTVFVEATNYYKLPQEVVDIADRICQLDDSPRVAAPRTLYCYLRQYNQNISLMYGRNAEGYISAISDIDQRVAKEIESDAPDYDYVFMNAAYEGCNFVITYAGKVVPEEVLSTYGYVPYISMYNYVIYANTGLPDGGSEGFRVTQYGSSGKNLMMYTVEDKQGNLIVIDGGSKQRSRELLMLLDQYDRHVAAWIITNYDEKHVGAFSTILSEDNGVVIDKIYAAPINRDRYLETGDSEDNKNSVETACKILDSCPDVSWLKEGDQIDILGMSMEVLSAWDEDTDAREDRLLEAGSLCFVLEGDTERMLFCSNITTDVERKLRDKYRDKISVTYLQAARQGKNGLVSNIQKYTEPEAVFLDAVEESFQDKDADAKDLALRDYYAMSGCRIYYYSSRPNTVILK